MRLRSLFLMAVLGATAFAQARANETLTVYTHPSFAAEWGPGPAVKAAFEQQCDCTLQYVVLDSGGDILQRLRLEGASSQADVVLGLDTATMETARQTGLLAPHQVSLAALELPVAWRDELFVPYDWGYFAFVYDTEQLPNPPTSLDELIGAPDDLKIIIQDPRTSTPGLGLLLWMRSVYGDQAGEKWQALKSKILTTTKSWSDGYFSLFMNGEAPMILSYSTSPAYHMAIDKTDRYQAAAFEEGHYLQVEVAALVASSRHKALARRFLAFMLTPEFQREIPLKNVMYPAIDLGDELPDVFDRLIQPSQTLYLDPATVAEHRKAWLEEWLEAMSR
ncbi:thiamine ABC transporter substrate binding subunit [Marinobacter lutaoensis]|uniref:Thiamine-binding periplasmic protein n=1 Tax=Marinobacter lutaoensis TaxID=135739 RepID=A0A1V2DTP3_9GAMM|nr:thiamine ABC transporter substrate binding subunit [Marinobacter lutaoensis]MBE02401.1 thiamine ABC transporter substrate binding subunit [Marinobacter sp.]MBI43842.1 thiamine ABC transporter substrate binding subunit [Oceanospirillales bacterium]NVD34983.1 thiamine ABC transporter substrate binding subunit [Marinobacter lutaoensis]ONF44058.1 thiamine ABC transporter substrate binding subunit [Marinobacter lutaoensis]